MNQKTSLRLLKAGFLILYLLRELYGPILYLDTIRIANDDIGATHKSAQIIFRESVGIVELSVHKSLPAHYGIQDHVSSPSSFLHTTSFFFTKVCMHPLVSFPLFQNMCCIFSNVKNRMGLVIQVPCDFNNYFISHYSSCLSLSVIFSWIFLNSLLGGIKLTTTSPGSAFGLFLWVKKAIFPDFFTTNINNVSG